MMREWEWLGNGAVNVVCDKDDLEEIIENTMRKACDEIGVDFDISFPKEFEKLHVREGIPKAIKFLERAQSLFEAHDRMREEENEKHMEGEPGH